MWFLVLLLSSRMLRRHARSTSISLQLALRRRGLLRDPQAGMFDGLLEELEAISLTRRDEDRNLIIAA
jgi:hypothetical protein